MRKTKKYTDYIKRIFLIYSIVIVGIIFCLYVASLLIAYESIIVQNTKKENMAMQQIVQSDFQAYRNEMKELVQWEPIRNALQYTNFTYQANEKLYAFRQERSITGNFALLNKEGQIITTNLYKKNAEMIESGYSIKRAMRQMSSGQSIYHRINDLELDNGQESRYFFAEPVFEKQQLIGYLFFFIENDSNLKITNADNVLVTDRYDNVIYSSSSSLISSMGKAKVATNEKRHLASVEEESYYIRTASVLDDEFTVYTMTSIQTFVQFLWFGAISLVVISIVISLLLYFIIPTTMKESVQSFNQLLGFITRPERKRNEQKFDEFRKIETEFEGKLMQINELVEHNKEIEETKRIMEIKQLESQFNPHFAFNVLEMLRYEITLNPKNAQDIIVSFANLLRYNTYYGNTVIELGTDLEYVRDYLKLQKMRFHNRLDYEIEINEQLTRVEVPKLILQPLIENSIKHNMEKVRHLFIKIDVSKVSEDLHISIQDDGGGITPEQLSELHEILEREENPSLHYGLYHTQRVIRLLYGKSYGLKIESEVGQGVGITAILPIRNEVHDA